MECPVRTKKPGRLRPGCQLFVKVFRDASEPENPK